MGRAKYDWRTAELALRDATFEIYAAARHRNHRKRVNVLNDLLALESSIAKIRKALLDYQVKP